MSVAVAVVICTRDREDSLRETLAAVAALEPEPAEVLVVDSASAVPLALPAIRVVREDVPGLDRARNRGLRETRAPLVAYTDDDARPEPGWVGALARAFGDPDVEAVTGRVLAAELQTEAQRLFERYGGGMDKGPHAALHRPGDRPRLERLAVQRVGVGANMAFRRRILEEIGGFDPYLDVGTPAGGGGDLDAFYRVLAAGGSIRYAPDAVVRHRHRRERAALREQLRANGRGYAAFLAARWARRDAPRTDVLLRGMAVWAPWLLGRAARGLVGAHPLPADLLLAELRGAWEGWIRRPRPVAPARPGASGSAAAGRGPRRA